MTRAIPVATATGIEPSTQDYFADRPVVTTEHVDYAITIAADQNPCGFDLIFTALRTPQRTAVAFAGLVTALAAGRCPR